MRRTLKSMLLDSVADSKHNTNNPHKYPSQILCLGNTIVFTDQCEGAIRSGKLSSFLTNLKEDLDVYTNQRMQESNSNNSSSDNKVLELKLKDLILDVIHHIEVVEYLIARNVREILDWNWQKQLRYTYFI
jgi:dynein heavy chain 2